MSALATLDPQTGVEGVATAARRRFGRAPAARTLGLKLQVIPVKHGDELAGAFDAMQRERAEVLVFGPDSVFVSNLDAILERARALKLPVIGPILPAAQRGALVSYGLDFRELRARRRPTPIGCCAASSRPSCRSSRSRASS